MNRIKVTVDGNEAAAFVAHKTNEVIAIYPITPSSPMGEFSDQWSVGRPAQHLGHGAAGDGDAERRRRRRRAAWRAAGRQPGHHLHRLAGPAADDSQHVQDRRRTDAHASSHVAARAVAAQGLSIFGDHQDVMAVRQTGWALLASNYVQEAMDTALIAQAATLESRVPFVHFFDGFRTSHEVAKIEQLTTTTCAP